MQTFLPYDNFALIASCLDDKRLRKQVVEGNQILKALLTSSGGWKNHPAVNMWKNYEMCLCFYIEQMIYECKTREFKYSKNLQTLYEYFDMIKETKTDIPCWLGDERLHKSHRSNLLRKDFNHYIKYWDCPDNLPYYWPV